MQSFILMIYRVLFYRPFRRIFLLCIAKIEGGWFWSVTIRNIFKLYHGIDVGYGTYGGAFDTTKIAGGTVFGNYCSIAPNVYVFNGNHPLAFFSQHPIFYNPKIGFVNEEQIPRTKLIIGHDVWIGANAIILPSVSRIGNGAVIGAGTVVTRDVKPYEVVAGNPARHIRYRFTPIVIDRIEKSLWWLLTKDELQKATPSLCKLTYENEIRSFE